MKTIRMILATAVLAAGLGAAGQVAHATDTHPAVKPALTVDSQGSPRLQP